MNYAPPMTPTPVAVAAGSSAQALRTSIARVEDAMSEFDRVDDGLSALAEDYPIDLVYDVATTKGMNEAIAHRAAWRGPRLTVERLRKQAKAPVLALGKDIDMRAAWLTDRLLLGETPIDDQIQAELTRKEAAKQQRILAEAGRIIAIQEAIAEIHMAVAMCAGKGSAAIQTTTDVLTAMELEPLVFQELLGDAVAAKVAALVKLGLMHGAALHAEAEAAKLAADRAELEKLRADAAEAKRIAAEQAKAAADAQRAEAAKLAADRADLDAKQAEFEAAKAEFEAAAIPVVRIETVAAPVAITALPVAANKPMPAGALHPVEAANIGRLHRAARLARNFGDEVVHVGAWEFASIDQIADMLDAHAATVIAQHVAGAAA